jgi:hypothetical protein
LKRPISVSTRKAEKTIRELTDVFFIIQDHIYQIALGQSLRATGIYLVQLIALSIMSVSIQMDDWHTFPLMARKDNVLATIMAELEDNPAPGGTVPVTSRSTETG